MKSFLKNMYRIIPYKKNIYRGLKKIIRLPSNIYQHMYFKGIISIQINSRKSFLMMHYGYYIENEIFWSGLYGGWEKESLKIWTELSKNSKTIFDIGANTGIYALIAKTVAEDSAVYAFEPVKRIYDKLKKNNELNQYNINCMEIALSNVNGMAAIYDPMTEHLYSVTVNKNLNDNNIGIEKVEITTKTILSIIKENNLTNIDLMKIDVETHEVEVLNGMGVYLKDMQPTMLIEILNNDIAKGVMEIIKDIDYVYYYIDEVNGPIKRNTITCEESMNFLICKQEVANELGLDIDDIL